MRKEVERLHMSARRGENRHPMLLARGEKDSRRCSVGAGGIRGRRGRKEDGDGVPHLVELRFKNGGRGRRFPLARR